MNHLLAFVPLGPDFEGCARWRSWKRGKDWGFSAGLSVPDREDHVYTSPKLPGTGSNMRKSSTGHRPNAVELILRDTLLIQHTWNGTYCKLPPLSLQCCLVKAKDVSWYSLEKEEGTRLLLTSGDCESHPGTCGLSSAPMMLAQLACFSFPCSSRITFPLCTCLRFGLTSSNLQHRKSRFFAFLYSGFSSISHPYLWCRTESCWLSGPTLEPFLWTNVTFVIFPSLGTNFDLSDRLYATWGHPAISYLNSLLGKFNVVLESCNFSFYLFTIACSPLCCGHQCKKVI